MSVGTVGRSHSTNRSPEKIESFILIDDSTLSGRPSTFHSAGVPPRNSTLSDRPSALRASRHAILLSRALLVHFTLRASHHAIIFYIDPRIPRFSINHGLINQSNYSFVDHFTISKMESYVSLKSL